MMKRAIISIIKLTMRSRGRRISEVVFSSTAIAYYSNISIDSRVYQIGPKQNTSI